MELNELGISEAKIKQLNKKNINSIEDLLMYLPVKYINLNNIEELSPYMNNQDAAFSGILSRSTVIGERKNALKVRIEGDRQSVSVIWFNQMYMYKSLDYYYGTRMLVAGKLSYNDRYHEYSFVGPTFFLPNTDENRRILAVYKKIKGMSNEFLTDTISFALNKYVPTETISEEERKYFDICEENKVYKMIHNPKNNEEIVAARKRLIFDDLRYFSVELQKNSEESQKTDYLIKKTSITKKMIQKLPFKLTESQMNAVTSLINKAKTERIDALLQGDVGSGKTIIAFILMLAFAENGYQSLLLAPTQMLAKQHYNDIKQYVEPFGFKACFLVNEGTAKEKKSLLQEIKDGKYNFIIGTHAAISKDVVYKNLALEITDEEHKFGVAQREKMIKDSEIHLLTMSATPIPRSLAITLYNETKQVITIDQMPSGRIPVKTAICVNKGKIYDFMRKQVKAGYQCYVVCPLIEESDNEKMSGVKSVEETAKEITDYFKKDNISIALLSSKTKNTEDILNDYYSGKTNILISTTVVEVGVNVPNSSTIVIINADRFGLATLHQLRGRVGRSNYQSYCILNPADACSEESLKRLHVLCETTNGFEIAEEDLKIRGAGDILGIEQSGNNKYINLVLMYPKFFKKIKEYLKKYSKSL